MTPEALYQVSTTATDCMEPGALPRSGACRNTMLAGRQGKATPPTDNLRPSKNTRRLGLAVNIAHCRLGYAARKTGLSQVAMAAIVMAGTVMADIAAAQPAGASPATLAIPSTVSSQLRSELSFAPPSTQPAEERPVTGLRSAPAMTTQDAAPHHATPTGLHGSSLNGEERRVLIGLLFLCFAVMAIGGFGLWRRSFRELTQARIGCGRP